MFIIAGLWHGGTSLVTSCCNSHPNIDMLYENQRIFPSFWDGRDNWKEYVTIEEEKKKQGKVFGAKFIENQIFPFREEFKLQKLKELEREYKDNKILFLFRDSRDYVISHSNRATFDKDKCVDRWNRFTSRALEYWKNNLHNCSVMKFEHFIKNPEKKLLEICSFIKIDYDPQMLKFNMMNNMYKDKYGNEIHSDRRKIYKNFKDQKLIKEVETKTFKGLDELGYIIEGGLDG